MNPRKVSLNSSRRASWSFARRISRRPSNPGLEYFVGMKRDYRGSHKSTALDPQHSHGLPTRQEEEGRGEFLGDGSLHSRDAGGLLRAFAHPRPRPPFTVKSLWGLHPDCYD